MEPFEIVELWPRGPVLLAGADTQKPGTDSVLLAGAAGPGDTIADLGCGAGVVSLLLAWDRPTSRVTGLELSEAACQLASRAVELNGLSDRVSIRRADLRDLTTLPRAGSFDCAVSNPPYFAQGSGKAAKGSRPMQRSEETCRIDQVCRAAAHLVRWGGTFTVVYRPERLVDLLTALRQTALEPKYLQLVRHRPQSPANLVLVQARRGGKPGLTIQELTLYDTQGRESADYRRLYHKEGQA